MFADDISDFEIEGISIVESLLDYYSESEINNAPSYFYKNNKYAYYVFKLPDSRLYDYLQITIKVDSNNTSNTSNEKYLIHAAEGIIIYKNNIEDC